MNVDGPPMMPQSTGSVRIQAMENAMASVKINFPSRDGVYMHDTPQQSLFGKMMRFDSSGCVRVQNVREPRHLDLARYARLGSPAFRGGFKTGENTPIQVTNRCRCTSSTFRPGRQARASFSSATTFMRSTAPYELQITSSL